jgi:hypothetical protein
MDLVQHQIFLLLDDEVQSTFSMAEGRSSSALAGDVFAAVSALGLSDAYDWSKFESNEPREYDPKLVDSFLVALVNADRIFNAHRVTLSGEVGPVQLWPHGFDLAFEWFVTRVEVVEEGGERQEHPSQLNLGFYLGSPGLEPYFYSNPWPFEADALLGRSLPEGASWHTADWQDTILPYAALVDDPDAEGRLLAYAQCVFELSAPTLTAE